MLLTGLTCPEVSPQHLPTKAEDRRGVATPNMVLTTGKNDLLGLVVDGNRITIQFNPLDKKKLRDMFHDDKEVSCDSVKSHFTPSFMKPTWLCFLWKWNLYECFHILISLSAVQATVFGFSCSASLLVKMLRRQY